MNRSDIRIGARLMFTGRGNATVYGTVVRINKKSITLQDTTDGAPGWRVGPGSLMPADGNDPGVGNTSANRPFRKRDRVTFKNGNRIIRGTVIRVSRKTVSVEPDGDTSGRYWRVSPSMLAHAKGADGGAAPPADTTARDKAQWKRHASMYGLPVDAFGSVFQVGGVEYRITGIASRRPKYPVSALRVRDGKPTSSRRRLSATVSGPRRTVTR